MEHPHAEAISVSPFYAPISSPEVGPLCMPISKRAWSVFAVELAFDAASTPIFFGLPFHAECAVGQSDNKPAFPRSARRF
jgi:hypothetical protein